jgi:hypothetical protein
VTNADIYKLLQGLDIPVAYHHFKTAQTAPFVVYLNPFDSNYSADNKSYVKFKAIQIELYTAKRDAELEARLERLLDENDLPYDKTEVWLEDENVYQLIYETEVN